MFFFLHFFFFFQIVTKKDAFTLQAMQRQSNTVLLISMESQPFPVTRVTVTRMATGCSAYNGGNVSRAMTTILLHL